MSQKILLIVESSKKAKTIGKILGSEYEVYASGGHIRDMPTKGGLGFDLNTFEIQYQMMDGKKDFIRSLRDKIKKGAYKHVILATDPDREGEAIALALYEELGLKEGQYERCKFNEITKAAITAAITGKTSKEAIDRLMTEAQEARRILDRYVGWECTKAVTGHLGVSAPVGRVQSQAVSFIVERDREIENFKSVDHYNVVLVSEQGTGSEWTAKLDLKASELGEQVPHKEGKALCWLDKEAATALADKLAAGAKVICESSVETEKERTPPPPYETTTMQQAAINNLKMSGKLVDQIAQSLYQDGHITYPRTDSVRMSEEGYSSIVAWGVKHGHQIVSPMREFKDKGITQGAHECIRPTDFDFDGEGLDENHRKLYALIKKRAVMSQMPNQKYLQVENIFSSEIDGKKYFFKATGSVTIDKGYKAFLDGNKEVSENEIGKDENGDDLEQEFELPRMESGSEMQVKETKLKSEKTAPPSLYTQAALNRKLDKEGIGRPSTYSAIFEKVLEHGYVEYLKGKTGKVTSTDLGKKLIDAAGDTFKIMARDFTRRMEDELDAIAENKMSKKDCVAPFIKQVNADISDLNKKPRAAGVKTCQKDGCGGVLITHTKTGKDGKPFQFWRCGGCGQIYFERNGEPVIPEDRTAGLLNDDGSAKHPCPKCKSAMKRYARKDGSGHFWGCIGNLSKTKCDHLMNDYEGSPDYEDVVNTKRKEQAEAKAREAKEAHLKSGGAQHNCPVCDDIMLPLNSQKGTFWKCGTCSFFASEKDGAIVEYWSKNNYSVYLDKDKKTPLYPCPDCGAALVKQPGSKDKPDTIRCSGVYPKKRVKCGFNAKPNVSVDKFHKKLGFIVPTGAIVPVSK